MLIKLLENRFIGAYGIILSVLVFHLGIAIPLFSLAASDNTSNYQQDNISCNTLDDTNSMGKELPLSDEEEQQAPTPSAEEEEDEKSKEIFEPWKYLASTYDKTELLEGAHKLYHGPFEVSTPPPEV